MCNLCYIFQIQIKIKRRPTVLIFYEKSHAGYTPGQTRHEIIFCMIKTPTFLLLHFFIFILFCNFTGPLQLCQKLVLVPAFNIWRADILIEPVVCSESRGIAGDHPFAVLKS